MVAHIGLPQIDATEVKPLKKSIKASYTETEVISENATLPNHLSPQVVYDMFKKHLNVE